MPEIPAGAKKPSDHKPALTAVVDDDELLADMPSLTPPNQLRMRQRNVMMKMALRLRSLLRITDDGDDDDAEAVEIDFDALAPEQLDGVLDLFAEVDEYAESLADDKAAYVEWAKTAGYDKFSALLARYGRAVGESTGSSS